MAALPASPVPTISPAEMQILISRSGLVLNPGQMADLVLAWRQVAGLIAAIPQGRPLVDDTAFSFRLPTPASVPPKPTAVPAGSAGAKATSGPAAKPKTAVAPRPSAGSKAKPRAVAKATPRAAAKAKPGAGAKLGAEVKAAPQSRAKPRSGPTAKATPKRQAARRGTSGGR